MINLYSLPHVTSVKHTIEPTWAKDAGRNSNSGKFSGTFVGWFDVLDVKVGTTNQEQMTQIRNAIEKPILEDVTFDDSKFGGTKMEDFYGTAIGAERESKRRSYKPFSFSLKAVSKRDDM